jgi:DNA-binding MarR family transcriptional regulator
VGQLDEHSRVRELASLIAAIEKGRRAIEHAHDVPTAELRMLWLLADGRPRTLKEIADETGLEQSTINRQVAAGRERGHLRRFSDPSSVSQLVDRTPEGTAAFEQAASLHLAAFEAGLAAVGDQEQFMAQLGRFVGAFGASANASAAR